MKKTLTQDQLNWLTKHHTNEEFKMVNIPNRKLKYDYAISKNGIVVNLNDRRVLRRVSNTPKNNKTHIILAFNNIDENDYKNKYVSIINLLAVVFLINKLKPNTFVKVKDGNYSNCVLDNIEIINKSVSESRTW